MSYSMRFKLKHVDYNDRIGFWAAISDGRQYSEMQPCIFKQLGENEVASFIPAFEMDHDSGQRLMDELWAIGIRPTEQGTGGQLEAVKYHLEDLRKLVFAKDSIESSKSTQTLNDVWDRIERTRAAKAGEEK